jgi:hypothetical protein
MRALHRREERHRHGDHPREPRDYLCIRHQRWLRGIHRPGLAALPEIAKSQRRHDRRTANVTAGDIARAHEQARDITSQWLEAGWHPALTEQWQHRHQRLALALPGPEIVLTDVITHPEMLAAAPADPQPAHSRHPARRHSRPPRLPLPQPAVPARPAPDPPVRV